ncbi:hypothetical protein OG948_46720 (plasmid) [Embleya sp. NBC_00888]|uniref:hypothetical protein n=1 Tax=Embleya sp. NBC_00888 TaxID=2975960 RepID=UPI002F90FE81|nr:hypothetical protein OG948_46720 [Embleya sp. NBC_00888]
MGVLDDQVAEARAGVDAGGGKEAPRGVGADRVKDAPRGVDADRGKAAPLPSTGDRPGKALRWATRDRVKTVLSMGLATDRGAARDSVARHLVRGAVGLGALVGAFALIPVVGPAALLLAPVGLIVLRGCPTCWLVGLIQAISAGRLERRCTEGRCELQVARPHARHPASKPTAGDEAAERSPDAVGERNAA